MSRAANSLADPNRVASSSILGKRSMGLIFRDDRVHHPGRRRDHDARPVRLDVQHVAEGSGEIFIYPPRWIPSYLRWVNYSEALTVLPFTQWYFNTTYITLVATLGQVLSASLVGYAFARLRRRAGDVLFVAADQHDAAARAGHDDPGLPDLQAARLDRHLGPLIVPAFLGGGAFNIFLCRQFFLTLPLELDDAARIDGCGTLGIYWRIILPLSKPVLAAVTVFSVSAGGTTSCTP